MIAARILFHRVFIIFLQNFSYFVFDNRLDNLPSFVLASHDRFGKPQRLFRRDIARQRRFARIDHRLDDRRPRMFKLAARRLTHLPRVRW